MEVKCKNCGKAHTLANDAVKNKKIYFFCSACGKKIFIDNRKGSSERNRQAVEHSDEPFYSLKDLIGGVGLAFNLPAVMLSLIYGLTSLLLIGGFFAIFSANEVYFISHPVISGIIVITTLSIIYFGYNLLLYMISKIHFYKMDNPEAKKVDWSNIFFDFKDDTLALFIISLGIGIILFLLLLPISLFQDFGLIYAGVFYPIFFILATILVLSGLLRNFIPAFIASKSRFLTDFFREFFKFIKLELINLPFYIFFIEVITFFVYSLVSIIFISAMIITGVGIAAMLNPTITSKLQPILYSIEKISSLTASLSGEIKIGLALFMVIFLIVLLLLWSLSINIKQSLYTRAIFIMQTTPIKSINKGKMLLFLAILFLSIPAIFFFIAIGASTLQKYNI
jgi:hypothetical protein